jgi:hypothetical protein
MVHEGGLYTSSNISITHKGNYPKLITGEIETASSSSWSIYKHTVLQTEKVFSSANR